jgi:serine/threonine protein kinase
MMESTPRWSRVKTILQEALARQPETRDAYLDQACEGDRALREEVDSLLRAGIAASAAHFAGQPAIAALATAEVVLPSLAIGQRLSHYQIEAIAGAGGMGIVYRARDTRPKLDRIVAIKVLPPGLRDDPEFLQRFERESRALAALNHPHICAVFDVGQEDGLDFIVMEWVAGETLAERLATRRPFPVTDALRVAGDIASALDAANAQGIIHRDLKPANIKVTPDGLVKVLDFGLVKVRRDPRTGGDPSEASSSGKTREGTTLGTVAYMSPEQARGKPVDKRADVWAFGCVLYELLTGRKAFPGETVSDTIAAVLTREPDWHALPHAVSANIQQLLRRCLERDLTRRLRDIGDAHIEIFDALAGSSSANESRETRSIARNLRVSVGASLLVAVSVMLAAAVLAVVRRTATLASPPERRFEIVTPPSADDGGVVAISPDGETVAFAATSNGETKLWLHSLRSGLERPLEGTTGANNPFWSPDSRSIAFLAHDVTSRTPGQCDLKRIEVDSGSIETLTTVRGILPGSWGSNGLILFTPEFSGPLARIPSTGGVPVNITSGTPHNQGLPRFLPDERHFLFLIANSDPETRGIYVGSLDGMEPRRLLDAQTAVFHRPSGQLLFVKQGTLFAQSLDRTAWKMTGNPYAIAERVAGLSAGLSVSVDGTISYRVGLPSGTPTRQFAWFDRAGNKVSDVGAPIDGAGSPSMSHDGRYVALYRHIGKWAVWLMDLERGVVTRLTLGAGDQVNPVWSPDGRRIVYLWRGKGASDLYQKSMDGSGTEEPLLVSDEDKSPTDWSADGRYVLYQNTGRNTGNDLWALPMQGDRKPFPVVQTTFEERDGQFSPDGRWVAYESNRSGRVEVYIQPFPGPGPSTPVSSSGGSQVRWRRDGGEIFYIAPDHRLMAVSVSHSPKEGPITLGKPAALFSIGADNYMVSADGQKFLLNAHLSEPPAPIGVILNWKAKP